MPSGTPGLVELVLRSLLICCVYAAFQNEACVVAADQVFTSEETLFGEIESVSTEAVRFASQRLYECYSRNRRYRCCDDSIF